MLQGTHKVSHNWADKLKGAEGREDLWAYENFLALNQTNNFLSLTYFSGLLCIILFDKRLLNLALNNTDLLPLFLHSKAEEKAWRGAILLKARLPKSWKMTVKQATSCSSSALEPDNRSSGWKAGPRFTLLSLFLSGSGIPYLCATVGSQLGLPWMQHRALELPNLFEKACEQNWLQIPGQTLGMVLPCMVENILSQAVQIIQEAKVGE